MKETARVRPPIVGGGGVALACLAGTHFLVGMRTVTSQERIRDGGESTSAIRMKKTEKRARDPCRLPALCVVD